MYHSWKYWEWQYNGVAPWYKIIEWCVATFGFVRDGKWSTNNFETIYFEREQDYVLFLLRWS